MEPGETGCAGQPESHAFCGSACSSNLLAMPMWSTLSPILAFIHHALGVLMLLYAWSIAYATAVEYEEVSYGSVKHA